MLITGAIVLSLVIVIAASIAKLGEYVTREKNNERANKRAESLQRARERSAILAHDAAARRAARAGARVARGGVKI